MLKTYFECFIFIMFVCLNITMPLMIHIISLSLLLLMQLQVYIAFVEEALLLIAGFSHFIFNCDGLQYFVNL